MAMTIHPPSHPVPVGHPTNFVESHHITLRRSSRLRVRRQGSHSPCIGASVHNTSTDTSSDDEINRSSLSRSRDHNHTTAITTTATATPSTTIPTTTRSGGSSGGKSRRPAGPIVRSVAPKRSHATYATNTTNPTLSASSRLLGHTKPKSSASSSSSSAGQQLAPTTSQRPNQRSVAAASGSSSRAAKRPRPWDLTDHELVASSPFTSTVDEEARTPRALRALKRQRLSLTQSSPVVVDVPSPVVTLEAAAAAAAADSARTRTSSGAITSDTPSSSSPSSSSSSSSSSDGPVNTYSLRRLRNRSIVQTVAVLPANNGGGSGRGSGSSGDKTTPPPSPSPASVEEKEALPTADADPRVPKLNDANNRRLRKSRSVRRRPASERVDLPAPDADADADAAVAAIADSDRALDLPSCIDDGDAATTAIAVAQVS